MPTKKQAPRGQLVDHAEGYHAYLLGLGYSPSAAKKHRHLVVHLSRWLDRGGIDLRELTDLVTDGFFRARRERGAPNLRTPRSLGPLLDYLRGLGVTVEAAPVVSSDPVWAFCDRFRHHLLVERGLATGTAHFYVYVAGLVASERRNGDGLDWTSLRAAHVTDFVTRTCAGRGVSSARQVLSALRSMLRFLAMEGLTTLALDDAVLSVAGRSPCLPRGISSADVEALVAGCDSDSDIGRRDRAIVLLLCRLGLRGGEVIGLRLDDIPVLHPKGVDK